MPTESDELAPIILSLPLRTPPEVNLEAVALLRQMLARAEEGKLNAVAILTASADGSVGTCYAGAQRWADLLAACEVFRCRLLSDGV
jgi:hypothetical protein